MGVGYPGSESDCVFEPFNPREVAPFGHFRTKQYPRPDDWREKFLGPARLALTGRLRDPWSDRLYGEGTMPEPSFALTDGV